MQHTFFIHIDQISTWSVCANIFVVVLAFKCFSHNIYSFYFLNYFFLKILDQKYFFEYYLRLLHKKKHTFLYMTDIRKIVSRYLNYLKIPLFKIPSVYSKIYIFSEMLLIMYIYSCRVHVSFICSSLTHYILYILKVYLCTKASAIHQDFIDCLCIYSPINSFINVNKIKICMKWVTLYNEIFKILNLLWCFCENKR